MNPYIEKLKQWAADNPPNFGDADSVLGLLYECFNENNPYDNEQINADFNELYQQMNGMSLREMDSIVYPVCRNYGFGQKNCYAHRPFSQRKNHHKQ